MLIKKMSILTFALIVFFIIIFPAQGAVNYTSLTNEYITNHPGQSIIPYPWEPTTSIKVLPFNYEIPASPSNNISLTACRDQFESATFIITARKNISGIGIHVSDLKSSKGIRMPSDAINVRLVKVWYQEGTPENTYSMVKTGVRVLTPELLIKDDTLVKVDYVNRTNYLKVIINGIEQYIDISTPTVKFPENAELHDAVSLQPFSLDMNENKQIWLTVLIPTTIQAGDYYGDIIITSPTESPLLINFTVTVLPFDLEPSPIEYGLFYRGILNTTPVTGIHYQFKTTTQYALELQNMKNHGVLYPTLYQEDNGMVDTALMIRNQSGLPTDKIYIIPNEYGYSNWIGNATDKNGLTEIANKVINWRNHTSSYGYQDVYFYGMDEVTGDVLQSQRTAWQTVHNNGGKMATSAWQDSDELLIYMGDILDSAFKGSQVNSTEAKLWHNHGHKIYLYGQPQVGVENPEIYRQNYGFALWNSGYDGSMDYAYQAGFGQSIWNDFDHSRYRDHVFAYPTTNGVIDTIQWEGWREGVDDTRYLATLIKLEGSYTTAWATVSDSLAKGEDMTTIRKTVIEKILDFSRTTNKKKDSGILNSVWNLTRFAFGPITNILVNGKWVW